MTPPKNYALNFSNKRKCYIFRDESSGMPKPLFLMKKHFFWCYVLNRFLRGPTFFFLFRRGIIFTLGLPGTGGVDPDKI